MATSNILRSKYPILAVAMNQVSDAKFAVACANAGITPSIGMFGYKVDGKPDYNKLVDDLIMYKKEVGNSDCMFTIIDPYIHDEAVMQILKAAGVRLIEIILPWGHYDMYQMGESLVKWRNHGFTLFQRTLQYDKSHERAGRNGFWLRFFDGVVAKGDKAAGAVSTQTLPDLITAIKTDYPNIAIIAVGGISTKAHVDSYLKMGATAVGVGTILAVATESCLSDAAKEEMIKGRFNKAKKTNPYKEKNALVFKPLHTGDLNYTLSLKVGTKRPDLGGHIYVGEGINNVKAIRPLKDIVADLV
jgi:hypothetical protein